MLIVFPLGLFVTAFFFDLIDLVGGDPVFGQVGFWNIAGGLVGAALAALFGLLDWRGIEPGTRARRIGVYHGLLNAVVLVLFLVAWLGRLGTDGHAAGWWFVFEALAISVSGVSAWLGGELVDRLGVGVDEGANPNAPSSLTESTLRRA